MLKKKKIMFCFLKKSRRQLLSILFIAAIIFITIQFLIINNFNSTTTIAILTTDKTEPTNQNNVIINKILMNKIQTTSGGSSNEYRAKRISQFKIPLDSNNQPELVNLLPFYHRFNHFNNFSLYFIDDPALISTTTAIKTQKKSTFIGIESENRMIDLSLLKKDDIDLDHINLDNIKGINKMNKLLYKPDSDGYFKCLNSNVN